MSLKSRDKITPQMADYDRIGYEQEWVPYLMSFCKPNCTFASVTTNNLGFRTTLDREGKPVGTDAPSSPQGSSEPRSIVVGSSTVFGVGATHDLHTIPSILNRITDGLWLNFGGRAFNSTQELILFMLHLPSNLDRILFFSGANNIVLASINNGSSSVYGAFFNESVFKRAMKNPSVEYIGVRQAAVRLLKEVRHRILISSAGNDLSGGSLDDCYDNILACFHRDLRVFKALGTGLGVRLYFALQPMATWIEKTLSPEEEAVFAILDALQAQSWQALSRNISSVRDRYFDDVAEICAEEDVPFYNLNMDPAFRDATWLFVDRVHLTDRGHALAAEIIKREFNL